jgi:hypothetical protein
MNYVTNEFVHAYQADLLRIGEKVQGVREWRSENFGFWRHFQLRLGNALIALGAWIKGESMHAELSHSQA